MSDPARQPVIITIDGPAGTGKSSVAHRLAERLGLEFLDTGAMYRGVAVIALHEAIDPADGPALAAAVRSAGMQFDWTADPPRLHIAGRNASRRIRDLDVSEIVSVVAAQPAVREVLVEQQRAIAAAHPRLVTEGRDQGSVVFPEAPVKFYLDAPVDVRAERRIRQLVKAGKSVDEAQVRRDIAARDRLDSGRDLAPLIRPEGAIVVDTAGKSLMDVVDELEAIVRARLPHAEFAA